LILGTLNAAVSASATPWETKGVFSSVTGFYDLTAAMSLVKNSSVTLADSQQSVSHYPNRNTSLTDTDPTPNVSVTVHKITTLNANDTIEVRTGGNFQNVLIVISGTLDICLIST